MPLLDIHHVAIKTQDLDGTNRFYQDVLGLESIDRPDFDFPGTWFDLGSTMFHIMAGDAGLDNEGNPTQGSASVDHVAVKAHDFDAMKRTVIRSRHAASRVCDPRFRAVAALRARPQRGDHRAQLHRRRRARGKPPGRGPTICSFRASFEPSASTRARLEAMLDSAPPRLMRPEIEGLGESLIRDVAEANIGRAGRDPALVRRAGHRDPRFHQAGGGPRARGEPRLLHPEPRHTGAQGLDLGLCRPAPRPALRNRPHHRHRVRDERDHAGLPGHRRPGRQHGGGRADLAELRGDDPCDGRRDADRSPGGDRERLATRPRPPAGGLRRPHGGGVRQLAVQPDGLGDVGRRAACAARMVPGARDLRGRGRGLYPPRLQRPARALLPRHRRARRTGCW